VRLRFLILNTDYSVFLRWLYTQHPRLEKQSYENQMRARNDSLFGMADFYSSNLRRLGHETYDIHANNEFMQTAWALEHGIRLKERGAVRKGLRRALRRPWGVAAKTSLRRLKPVFGPLFPVPVRQRTWFYDILLAQIKHYHPDVLLNQDMYNVQPQFLRRIKPYVRMLVGQHAATSLSNAEGFSCYDLVISSFPPTVEWFRKRGVPAELSRLGFEPRILSYLNRDEKSIPTSFVGSFGSCHSSRAQLLETLCARLEIKVWAPSVEHLSTNSRIRESYMGQAWGLEMYRILCRSQITLNHHGDIAPYANNCRLYEATGVGSLLITDWKANLHEMFEPGKEVVAYRTPEECAELIRYYLENDKERETIARAGQQRTLREHTYYQRMKELVDILRKYV